MKKIKRNPKGISPVIGEVLLIVLSISLALTVFIWTKNYTQNVQQGELNQASCQQVSFRAGNVCYDNIVQGSQGKKIEFDAINYSPNVSLSGFRITLQFPGGSKTTDINSVVATGETEKMISDFVSVSSSLDKVIISPLIQGSTSCTDQQSVFVGSEVNLC